MTFIEDFFERVINVTWEEEPEVYWIAASGEPLILNGMVFNNKPAIFTSENGHNWAVQEMGLGSGPGEWGFSAFYGGGWMREALYAAEENPGDPRWVLIGCDGRLRSGWASATSLDGITVIANNHNEAAEQGSQAPHSSCENFAVDQKPQPPTEEHPEGTSGSVKFKSVNNFTSKGKGNIIRGSDGVTWTAEPKSTKAQPSVAIRVFVGFEGGGTGDITFPEPEPQAALFAETREGDDEDEIDVPAVQKKANKKIFANGVKTSASGRVKNGPHEGKVVKVTLENYSKDAPAHGDGSFTVQVQNPDTKEFEDVGGGSSGLLRAITIGYGHYAFVIGGTSGGGTGDDPRGNSTVAFSDDGVNFQVIELGRFNQVNVVAVGPRKEQRSEGEKHGTA